jgi:hypothetical protein
MSLPPTAGLSPLAAKFRLQLSDRTLATLDFLVAAAAFVTLAAVVCFSARVFIDGDTNWHVAAGRWILAHQTAPASDPFSYTYAGKPWLAHEWLAEVLMAMAYAAAGWSGVVLAIGLCAAVAYAMIAAELRLWLGPVGQAIGLGLSFACLEPFLFARPHIIALPLLVGWTRSLLAARRQERAPPLALTPLMMVWANLHASFIFGLGLIGPFALEAVAGADRTARLRTIRDWGLFGALAVAFSLATPHGLKGLLFPFQVLGMKVLPNILEWRAANFQEPTLLEGALLGALFLGLWKGVRTPPLRLALLVALVHMALQHIRQQAVLAALAPLLLAEPFGRALRPGRPASPTPRPWPAAVAVAVLAFLSVAGVRLAIPLVRRDNVNVPVSAMAHVPPDVARLPVFNEYAFGGYLIFKGVKPFIDGRADMYGDDFVREYLAIVSAAHPQTEEAFKRWNIRWTILAPHDALVGWLDRQPGWRRLYSDPWAVVQVREEGAPH